MGATIPLSARLSCRTAFLYTRATGGTKPKSIKHRRVLPQGRFCHETMASRALRAAEPLGICAIDLGARASVRLGAEFHQAAAGHAPGRSLGRGGEFQGQCLRLFAWR